MAELRNYYAEQAAQVQTAFQNLSDYLAGALPPEPDYSLAESDPQEYMRQTALRNQLLQEIQGVFAMRDQVNEQTQKVSQFEGEKTSEKEHERLIELMPEWREPARLEAVVAQNKKTALELGFSEQEIENVTDHRVVYLMHLASLGKRSLENKKNAQKRIAEKPIKGRKPKAKVAPRSKQKEALRRLEKTGSLDDALSIDF